MPSSYHNILLIPLPPG